MNRHRTSLKVTGNVLIFKMQLCAFLYITAYKYFKFISLLLHHAHFVHG